MKRTIVPIGPFHPILEEPEFFTLEVEGEKVVDADVRISYNHRGIEKISEGMTYDQVPFLVARVCGICSACHPFAYVTAAEDLLGIEAPERAAYIRTIVAELERIHSHLLWVGLAGHFVGYNTVFMWAWRYREPVLDICELVTGNRNHYDIYCVGGVRRDISEKDFPAILKMCDDVEGPAKMLTDAVLDDPVLHARLKGIGILSEEDGRRYGITGPTARGSNIPIDVRKDEPYAAYDKVSWSKIVQPECDVFAKAVVRLLEIFESVKIIRGCIEKMKPGPIQTEVREIREGEGIGHCEAPRGEVFHYVRSNGTNMPFRHKIRAPTYVNLPSFKACVIGQQLADAMLVVAAMDPCYSCTERVAVVDWKTGDRLLDGRALIKMSQEKTERLRRKIKG